MKKLLVLLLAVILLTACSADDQPKEESKKEEAPKQDEAVKKDEPAITEEPVIEDPVTEEAPVQEEVKAEPITAEKVKEIIEYVAIGEDDKLISVIVEGNEIKAVIELAPHNLLSAKDLAVSSYSQASDELLDYEGWETLTIEYLDIGKASMNRLEKETNEYGMDYFPTMEIENRLK